MVTEDFVKSHLYVGGNLRVIAGKAEISPICGPYYWQWLEVPVSVMKNLLRARLVKVCSYNPYGPDKRPIRYYSLR